MQLDEIFDSLDPETRKAFRGWQQDLAKGIEGRGRDFNDALGTLPGFAADGSDVLGVLDSQEQALQRLVKNTGVTFAALTENEQQLRTLITSSQRVFEATGSRNEALAESVRIFPTFLDESKATLARLETFSTDTRPLVQDLRPVAVDLKPTLGDLRATAPHLEKFFRDLDPLIEASKKGMPAARETIEGAEPLLAAAPSVPRAAQPDAPVPRDVAAAGLGLHLLRRGGAGRHHRLAGRRHRPLPAPVRADSAPRARRSTPSASRTNRGSTYVGPEQLFGPEAMDFLLSPSSDCRNAGGETKPSDGTPGCYKADAIKFQGRIQGDFPHVEATDYTKPSD